MTNEPRHVLLLIRRLAEGGCERDLTKMAIGLDRSRFISHVGCFREEGIRTVELYAAGIPVVCFGVRSFHRWSALSGAWRMWRYIRRHRIRLVHCFDVPADIYGVFAARAFGLTVISSQLSYRTLVSPLERRLLRATDRLASAILVNCKAMHEHLVRDEGVPPERLFLSYNGFDPGIFHPAPGPSPVRPQGASLVIGIIANLRAEKGVDLLLDAFAQVRGLRPGLKLLIVGSGPLEGELMERSSRLGLGESCHFEPSKVDVSDWARAIDIFVQPSLSEAFSNSVLEAMASGCCLAASRVGGNPELVLDGQTGLLFDTGSVFSLAEALRTLISDDALRVRLAQAGCRYVHQNFTMEIALRRMQDFYSRILARVSA